MISLVPSSAKTSDFTSPKELKDQLPITWDLLQSFVQKVFLFFFSWNGGRICVLEDAYASSIFQLAQLKIYPKTLLKFCNFSENIIRPLSLYFQRGVPCIFSENVRKIKRDFQNLLKIFTGSTLTYFPKMLQFLRKLSKGVPFENIC